MAHNNDSECPLSLVPGVKCTPERTENTELQKGLVTNPQRTKPTNNTKKTTSCAWIRILLKLDGNFKRVNTQSLRCGFGENIQGTSRLMETCRLAAFLHSSPQYNGKDASDALAHHELNSRLFPKATGLGNTFWHQAARSTDKNHGSMKL